jgi:hypothetical protein
LTHIKASALGRHHTGEMTNNTSPPSPWRSPGRWVLIGFLLIAAFFAVAEHRAHLLGAVPYLLLLACPVMHMFHHGHHRHHGDTRQPPATSTSSGQGRDHGS